MQLTSGASDGIGQHAAAAAHVAQHIAWVTSALATAEDQLVAMTATLSSRIACPCTTCNCPCKCGADPCDDKDP